MRISAIIIGYNEAKYIQRCLDNAAEWADEIIYFDSFSTDGSDDIARTHKSGKVRLFQHRYDNTRDQRNRALEVANHDWRFLLDVDEYLSDAAIQYLPDLMEMLDQHSDVKAVRFERINWVDGINMGQEGVIHMVKRGVTHAGHPLHADRAPSLDGRDILTVGQRVIHDKTSIQWMERARIYWWMCPYTFGVNIHNRPPGSEDLEPPLANWHHRHDIDVMTEFMDAGLDKRLTAGYLKAQGLEITPTGWRRKS